MTSIVSMRVLLGALLLTASACPVWGQDRALVDAWLAQQQAVLAQLDSVVVREAYTLAMDGPFGERTRSHEHMKRLWPPAEARETYRGRRGHRPRRGLRSRRLPFAHVDATLLRHLSALYLSTTEQDALAGRATIRYRLEARDRQTPIRTLLLWIDPASGRLLQSHLDLRLPLQDEPLRIETTYQHLDGLDVPAMRRVDGRMRRERRGRTFSHSLSFQAHYTDPVLQPRR